jgi:hypothetical protein
MEKVKRDQTIGLLALLVALVALAVFSASLPVMADYQAEQNATVTKSETLQIKNQNETYDVTYWNFTASIGTNSTDVNNSWAESQNPTDNNTPVARIENPNPALNLLVSNSSKILTYLCFNPAILSRSLVVREDNFSIHPIFKGSKSA